MITVKRQYRGFEITAQAERVGEDWHLRISGGDTPHIGTLSFAWLEQEAVQVQSLVRPSHKDHIVGEAFARAVAEQSKRPTAVVSGIHYDNLSKEEIMQLVLISNEMLEELLRKIDCFF